MKIGIRSLGVQHMRSWSEISGRSIRLWIPFARFGGLLVKGIPKGAQEKGNRSKPLLAIDDPHRDLIVVNDEIANEILPFASTIASFRKSSTFTRSQE